MLKKDPGQKGVMQGFPRTLGSHALPLKRRNQSRNNKAGLSPSSDIFCVEKARPRPFPRSCVPALF